MTKRLVHFSIAPLITLILCLQQASAQTYSLVIGVDGLGSYGLQAADTPNLDALINGNFGNGSYSGALAQHSFAGGVVGTETQQITKSGPGWTSIHTGVWNDQHGVTTNNFNGSDFTNNPSFLKTLEESLPSIYTASAVAWSPIDSNIIASVDDGNSMMDFRRTGADASNTTAVTNQLAGLSANDFAALFVHLNAIDTAGHGFGAYSTEYLARVTDVDNQIGSMLTAIQNRANFANEDWQIVVTSDHGQLPSGGHGGQTQLERNMPIIIASKDVGQGFISTAGGATSIVDIAPTVLGHFETDAPTNYVGQALGNSVISTSSSSNLSSGLTQGLIQHITFDGDAAAGLAGNGGTVNGNAQFVDGKFSQAATVDQYGDGYVRLVDDLADQLGVDTDFTMSMWMKYDSFTGEAAFFSNKDWVSGGNIGINLALNPNNTLDFNSAAAAGTRLDAHPLEGLNPGIWQNILFTVDRDELTNLYIDGMLMGSIDSSVGSFDGLANWVFLNDGTGNYVAGGSLINGLMIDEFAAWDRILTNDEVSFLARSDLSSAPEPELLGDCNLDGVVDFSDIPAFISILIAGDYLAEADTNEDGVVDFADIPLFVEILQSL